MSQLHAITATLAMAVIIVATLGAALVAARGEWARHAGRALAVVGGALVVAAATGAGVFVTSGPPGDALHLLYGVVALGIVVGTVVVRGRPSDRRALPTLVAALFLMGVGLRLVQTGG